MVQILVGALAFALALAFDWASWRHIRFLKPLLGTASLVAFAAALAWVLATPARLALPPWTRLVGWPLIVLASALLLYSLFIEIPFAATYAREGTGEVLVTTGTYALTRHPGVLWLGLWLLGCTLLSRVRLMAAAGAAWFVLDIVYVWLQDAFLFPRMFAGYRAYRRETPMLVPTRRSLAACLRTLPCHPHPPVSRGQAAVSHQSLEGMKERLDP